MIQFTNVSEKLWAIDTKGRTNFGHPRQFHIEPNNFITIAKQDLKNYTPEVKEQIADAVRMGVLLLYELNSVHTAAARDFFEPIKISATNEQALVELCNKYKNWFNDRHVKNTAFHTASGTTLITAADATDYTGCYAILSDAITQHNAHMADAIHPTADTTNNIAAVPPTTPSQALAVLKVLTKLLDQHKGFAYLASSSTLSPNQIINY